MELLLASILFLIGLGLIVKGGDLFVDAAVWMARASGMPQFLIGATIVSLATTMPELVVSSLAALHGNMEMAIGNAVGSVTANTGLILGLSVVMLPIAIVRRHFLFKGLLLVLSCAVLTWFCQDGSLTLPEACIMLALFVLFLTENILHARAGAGAQAVSVRLHPPRREIAGNLFFFLVGAISLVVGSRLLVDNGELLAIALGVPTRIIAITLVAIGTSLPELVTAVTALVKRQGSMSVGNILVPISSTSQSFFPCVPFCPRTHFQSQLPAVCWTFQSCFWRPALPSSPRFSSKNLRGCRDSAWLYSIVVT